MKKFLGVSLISALILTSCQKKEEATAPAGEETALATQTQNQAPAQTQQPVVEEKQTQETKTEDQKSSEPTKKQPEAEKQKEEPKKEQEQTKTASVDGKSIFTSKGCGSCHQEAVETVGPSLKKIVAAYGGDKNKLLTFFKGEGKAIVDPAKEAIMKPQIEVIKKLSKEEQEALADFILKH
ncbi:MAG: c-type cytochrome [Hydrogenothermaceae bacterium]|nr:c-type cytochrome [Hydrogenothermaceae bacterium]